MASDLIQTMLGLGAVVRPYMAKELAKAAGPGLTDRDVVLLQFVAEKGQTTFAEIADRVPRDEHFQIHREAGASGSRLSAALAALFSEHGVIKKEINPENQRQTIVTLTPKGRRIVDKVVETRSRVYQEIRRAMNPLSREEEAKLNELFVRTTENFKSFLAQK